MTTDIWPPDEVRNMGTYVVASKGSGKSRLLGRLFAKQDALRGIPQLIIDPAGGTIDNFLDSILRLPSSAQRKIWPRVVYVDLGNRHAVTPFPLYYRLFAHEGLYQIAQRYLDVVKTLDPHLASASVEGWNALWDTGSKLGMILAAMGGQMVEAVDMLNEPKKWQRALSQLAAENPEIQEQVTWLTKQYASLRPDLRMRRTSSFLQKSALFYLDSPIRAMFNASQPGLNWDEIIANRKTVLIDFRHILDSEMRRFLMLWTLDYFLSYIKRRGIGRHTPIGLIIDEISILTNVDKQSGRNDFTTIIDEFLNVWARQGQVWTTLSHQEVWQVPDDLLKSLMGCGTRIVGRTGDDEAALRLAKELVPAFPRRVKRYDPVMLEGASIGYRPVEYSMDEQHYLASMLYRKLGAFEFYFRTRSGEGGSDTPLQPLHIHGLEPGAYPDDSYLPAVRAKLHARTAIPVRDLLVEIDARRRRLARPKESQPAEIVTEQEQQSIDDDDFLVE